MSQVRCIKKMTQRDIDKDFSWASPIIERHLAEREGKFEKEPEISKLHMVYRVKTLKERPYWEKEMCVKYGLDEKVQYLPYRCTCSMLPVFSGVRVAYLFFLLLCAYDFSYFVFFVMYVCFPWIAFFFLITAITLVPLITLSLTCTCSINVTSVRNYHESTFIHGYQFSWFREKLSVHRFSNL